MVAHVPAQWSSAGFEQALLREGLGGSVTSYREEGIRCQKTLQATLQGCTSSAASSLLR